MNKYVFTIISVLFVFSCKSNKIVSKDIQIQTIELSDQQIASENSVMDSDVMLYAALMQIGTVPKFNGDSTGVEFWQYVATQLRYPVEAHINKIQGRVIVEFVIDENGFVIYPVVLRGVHKSLDAEAIRVVASSPQWTPGYVNDKPVKTRHTFLISFTL